MVYIYTLITADADGLCYDVTGYAQLQFFPVQLAVQVYGPQEIVIQYQLS